MEEIKLAVQLRTLTGRRQVRKLRRQNFLPAIVYGENKEPTAIQLDRRDYERITRQHRGQSVLFHINIMEGDKAVRDYSAIVREEQHNPVTEELLHVDFNQISLTKEVEVRVPLLVKGDAPGVKTQGGSLDQPLRELDVVCLPTNIPEKIVIDVGGLNIGDTVHVKDITLPAGVRTKHDPEALVVSVVPPMAEVVEAPAEGEAPKEPEVLREKKDKDKEVKAEEQKAEPKKAEGKEK